MQFNFPIILLSIIFEKQDKATIFNIFIQIIKQLQKKTKTELLKLTVKNPILSHITNCKTEIN